MTWFINQLREVITNLVSNWLWQKYANKNAQQEIDKIKDGFARGVIRRAKEEAIFNQTPGIGDFRTPFRSEAILELLYTEGIRGFSDEDRILIRETVAKIGVCNGGHISCNVRPGVVKGKCGELITRLAELEKAHL